MVKGVRPHLETIISLKMIDIALNYYILHIFVLFGWIAKKLHSDNMNEKSFVILSIYFLQPLLTFWGLMVRPIDWNAILIPVVYGVGMCVALAILGVFRS